MFDLRLSYLRPFTQEHNQSVKQWLEIPAYLKHGGYYMYRQL